MATKRFLFGLVLFSLLFLSLTGCQTMKDNIKTNRDSVIKEGGNNPIDPETNQPVIKDSTFTSTSAPKLGIILGGGGVLTYAQIGVLHELSKHKINVHSIVGMEWGALVAAAYSKTGRAHEIEWQLLKMPHALFSQKGVFTNSTGGVPVDRFGKFIKSVFKDSRLNSAKIPFACPYINMSKARESLSTKGYYKNVLITIFFHKLFNESTTLQLS